MKTTTVMAFLLVVLAGCAAKKQVMQSTAECIAARDAAQRAAASCDRCCQTPPMRK
jgi:hypothetical protein